MGRGKRVEWQPGDLFLVPQQDGRYSLGQVIVFESRALNGVLCGFYDIRFETSEIISIPEKLTEDKCISMVFVTSESLDFGHWKIIGNLEPANINLFKELNNLRAKKFIGARIIGSGIIDEFLDAFYGIKPWDDWADPNYLDELLISPDKKPKKVLLKSEIT